MSSFAYHSDNFPDIQRMPILDNFAYVIPVDYKEHTEGSPFCWDEACPCHEDEEQIAKVNEAVQNGLMTTEEATEFVRGKLL